MAKPALMGIVLATLPIAAAQAAPATADEASRLKTLFERYVGAPAPGQPSAVTVTPQGDSYSVGLDLKQALKGLETFGMTIDPNTSTTMLTPLDDGTWKVTSTAGFPVVVHMRNQVMSLKAASNVFEGVYDPSFYAFKTAHADYTGYGSTSTAPTMVQNSQSDKLDLTFKGMPADGGTVTGTAHETIAGLKADALIKPPSSAEPSAGAAPADAPSTTAFSYATPSATLDLGFEKLHSKDLLDLWAFLVAHPDRASLTAAQDQFRGILRLALPLASGFTQSGTIDGLSVTTPIGMFTAKTASSGIDLAKLDGAAKATTTLSFSGLTLPSGQLPPWTEGLVPTDLSLTLDVTGLHPADAAAEAVKDFDLKSDTPFTPDQTARIGNLALPGAAFVTLRPSRVTSKLLDLKVEGGASLGTTPDWHVTIKATGLDKAIASLQSGAQSDPSAAQALGPLVLAKNLAKPEADGTLSWLVESKGGGPVTVNGTPLQ